MGTSYLISLIKKYLENDTNERMFQTSFQLTSPERSKENSNAVTDPEVYQ